MSTVVSVIAVVAAVLLLGVLAYAGCRIAGELHKQSCIQEAQANFPAVAIEARGKVVPSFVGPRRSAVADCEATVF